MPVTVPQEVEDFVVDLGVASLVKAREEFLKVFPFPDASPPEAVFPDFNF